MLHYIRALAGRLRVLFGGRKSDRELDDEIEAHLGLLIERHVRQGMTEGEAAQAARRQFGNITLLQEGHREMRGITIIETFVQDLRYGLRMMRRNPGFSFVAVLTLALGIGATTAIFSVVNAALLRPLPYPDSQRLAMISESFSNRGLVRTTMSVPEYLDFRERSRSFEHISAYRFQSYSLTGAGEAETLQGVVCSTNLFDAIGVKPAIGRAFLSGEDQPGANRVVVLSHGLWSGRFGADPQVIGRRLTLNGDSVEIIGVAPSGFQFPARTALWTPIRLSNELLGQRAGPRNLLALARLKPEITLEAAEAEMKAFARRLQEEHPTVYSPAIGFSIEVTSLRRQIVGDLQTALWTLMGAVAFVLLIACANVANLLLARAAARERETAIRAALGASRGRIIRQLLTESITLSLLGGLLGALIAYWGVDALLKLNPNVLPPSIPVSVDGTVLMFALAISFLTGVIFGSAPALNAARLDLNFALKESGRSRAGGLSRFSLRSALVALEVALSFVLLVGAGLLIRSFLILSAVDPGFRAKDVLTGHISLPQAKYPEKRHIADFYQQVLARVSASPGVQSAGLIAGLPFSGSRSSWGFTTEANPQPANDEVLEATVRVVSPGYFPTMGVPLRRGRDFTAQDDENAPGGLIINETMARRFWPNEDPLGKRIKLGSPEPQRPWDGLWLTILGVVGDVRATALESDPAPEMYLSYQQNPWRGMPSRAYMTLLGRIMSLAVRSEVEPANLAPAIRQAVAAVDKDQPVSSISTMERMLESSTSQRRFNLFLLSIFAGVALLLAAIGLYGVMSYTVTQSTRDIGVRMALGARAADVIQMVIKQGMTLTLVGGAIGLIASIALMRLMTSLLFGVSATDPMTFGSIALLLAGVAFLACYIPARRATKVDPLQALRQE